MDYSAPALLEKLISFPTVSRDSNLALVGFVEDYLNHHGIDSHRVPAPCGTKAGLVAQVGPNVEGGVVLSAHTDVVPIDGQDWHSDPWQMMERDGRYIGRGTCDMKGFVALALHAMVQAKSRPLTRPLQIALSRDEEIGLLGASDVARALLDHYPKASAVIVGEPTEMRVVTGHKSCEGINVHIRGHEVHSSRLFEGVSAITVAAQIIDWFRTQTQANQQAAPTPIAALYDPPFTTMHVGVVQGGTASNITARDCCFTADLRCVGDERAEDWMEKLHAFTDPLQAQMQAVHPDTFIDISFLEGPALAPEPDGAAEALVRRITGDNGVHTVAYGTDGGHFQRAGFSTVICGPGSIAQAHQPNEFLDISQFDAGAAMLSKLITSLEQ